MACGLGAKLKASDGKFWLLSVFNGQILATQVSDGETLVLRDYTGATDNNFALDIVDGFFTTTAAGTAQGTPTFAVVSDNVGSTWSLVVDGGGVLYTREGEAGPPQPVLGQILPSNGEGYPPAYQPGGPYTPVLEPVQARGGGPLYAQIPSETTGRFYGPCGHNFANYRVLFQAIDCTPSALITCPLCSILIRVMTVPEFQNYTTNPIVQG